MGKTVTFQAVNNRIQFRCPHCNAKRNMAIPPDLRKKSVRCHKCGETTRCGIDRRTSQRSYQAGKVVVVAGDGRQFEVNLHDISATGAAFNLPLGKIRPTGIAAGKQVKIKCGWNPRLFGNSSFLVKNVLGRRVGVQRV